MIDKRTQVLAVSIPLLRLPKGGWVKATLHERPVVLKFRRRNLRPYILRPTAGDTDLGLHLRCRPRAWGLVTQAASQLWRVFSGASALLRDGARHWREGVGMVHSVGDVGKRWGSGFGLLFRWRSTGGGSPGSSAESGGGVVRSRRRAAVDLAHAGASARAVGSALGRRLQEIVWEAQPPGGVGQCDSGVISERRRHGGQLVESATSASGAACECMRRLLAKEVSFPLDALLQAHPICRVSESVWHTPVTDTRLALAAMGVQRSQPDSAPSGLAAPRRARAQRMCEVAPGGWAAWSGVEVGDELVAVNGKAAERMHDVELRAALRARPLRLCFASWSVGDRVPRPAAPPAAGGAHGAHDHSVPDGASVCPSGGPRPIW